MGVDSICFAVLSAYPLISGSGEEMVGGAEVQQYLLAREFLKHGAHVKFVTFDHGQDDVEIIDGMEIIKSCRPLTNPVRKILAAGKIGEALERADADIYYQRGAEMTTVLVRKFCRKHGKKFVHSVSADSQIDRLLDGGIREAMIRRAIGNADMVICQSGYQHARLKEMNIESTIIKNGIDIKNERGMKNGTGISSDISCGNPGEDGKDCRILWVGTIREEKKPEVFMDLACVMPEYDFVMVGGMDRFSGRHGMRYHELVKKRAKAVENLEFRGFVPYHKVGELFHEASVFVNTSEKEGFPNTFLQAWSAGIPVVSLNVDPGNVIADNEIGFCADGDLEALENSVRGYMTDHARRQRHGKKARRHVEREHDIEMIAKGYLDLFEAL